MTDEDAGRTGDHDAGRPHDDHDDHVGRPGESHGADAGNGHSRRLGDEFSAPAHVPSVYAPATRTRVVPLAAAGLVLGVFVLVLSLIIALRRPAEPLPPSYDERTRAAFVESCVADGGTSTLPVCECAYERIVQTITFTRFRELDALAQTRRGGAGRTGTSTTGATGGVTTTTASLLPTDVQEILVGCVARTIISTPSSTNPTTTPATTATTTPTPPDPAPTEPTPPDPAPTVPVPTVPIPTGPAPIDPAVTTP